jgi:hypothetical protein
MGSIIGIRKGTEEVPYTIIENFSNFEVRQYGNRLVIETLMRNSDDLSESNGFGTLASFIFGKNNKHEKIAMTAPVEVRPNEHCMNEPNEKQASLLKSVGSGGMIMRFTLPHDLKEEDIPKPLNKNVNVTKAEPEMFATLKFSGGWSEASFKEHSELLLQELAKHSKYFATGPVISMRYDPPWTISCFRRNEVAVRVDTVDSTNKSASLAAM